MVSHPETGSDSPIGSDRDRGRDTMHTLQLVVIRVDNSSPFSFLTVVTPDFLGTTWVGLTQVLSDMG